MPIFLYHKRELIKKKLTKKKYLLILTFLYRVGQHESNKNTIIFNQTHKKHVGLSSLSWMVLSTQEKGSNQTCIVTP